MTKGLVRVREQGSGLGLRLRVKINPYRRVKWIKIESGFRKERVYQNRFPEANPPDPPTEA
jgi:hypothetical protein